MVVLKRATIFIRYLVQDTGNQRPAPEYSIQYRDDSSYKQVLLNPYSGDVQKVKNMNRDFFRTIVDGHFYL